MRLVPREVADLLQRQPVLLRENGRDFVKGQDVGGVARGGSFAAGPVAGFGEFG